MGKIINSEELGISKEQMKNLYRQNLISCDDYDCIIAEIPDWAINEVVSILGFEINGTEIDDSTLPINIIDMSLYNHYHYPKLYNLICKKRGKQYEVWN